MTYNYHTHTARCRHASGTEEEYILRAIKCGITHMGFSDHLPFRFPDGSQSGYRVPMEQAKEYMETLYALREKYKKHIRLHIGFEMEYYPTFFPAMLETARTLGAEYLLLGQHFTGDEHPYQNNFYVVNPTDDPALLDEYVTNVLTAMDTGLFTYVAHPDIMHFTGDSALYERQMRRICVAAREKTIPLEINLLGIRDGRHYPREEFWRFVGEEGSPVTFGFDAHDPQSAYDEASIPTAMELVEKYGLNYIGEPALVPL